MRLRPRLLSALLVLSVLPNAAFATQKTCAAPEPTRGGGKTIAARASDPKVRGAAQKGVHFLSRSTAQWQKANGCYGCHVQAVTLEGLAVGKHHQYDVPADELKTIVDGMLFSSGGARTAEGLTHSGYPRTSKTFGGAAFARYDQYLGTALRDDLVKLARELLAFQAEDGSVSGDHVGRPVTTGPLQATYQAMQTWRQVYTFSADDEWLTPIRRAESFIARTAATWEGNPKDVYLQDVNYALMGLVAAGASRSEAQAGKLVSFLLEKQRADGGWSFDNGGTEGASDPFATGQTVYALRLAGLSEGDRAVSRGIDWLVEHQKPNGGWGGAGSGKAEAMWAVMGLVSVDVVTVAVTGVQDGERVSGTRALKVEARDNQGGAIQKVELFVNDLPVSTECSATLSHAWDTSGLKTGKHTVDVVATNSKGNTTRRRIEVWAGDVFLTELSSRYSDDGTQVTVRNIGPKAQEGTVLLRVLAAETKGGAPKPGGAVWETKQPAAQGPMRFHWSGKGTDGKERPNGRYFAEVAYLDAKGKVVQTERALFTHDTPERMRQSFGEVSGQLTFAPGSAAAGSSPAGRAGGGAAAAANAEVELLDEEGRVVQRVMSNADGQYRFKAVDKGEYRVRVKKEGFSAREAPVQAAPSADSKASLSLH